MNGTPQDPRKPNYAGVGVPPPGRMPIQQYNTYTAPSYNYFFNQPGVYDVTLNVNINRRHSSQRLQFAPQWTYSSGSASPSSDVGEKKVFAAP